VRRLLATQSNAALVGGVVLSCCMKHRRRHRASEEWTLLIPDVHRNSVGKKSCWSVSRVLDFSMRGTRDHSNWSSREELNSLTTKSVDIQNNRDFTAS
jgi:hypothetical protein